MSLERPRVVWVYPVNRKCGISFYSVTCTAALAEECDVECLSPEEFRADRRRFASRFAGCDLAHVQYEPSFFLERGRDFFPAMMAAIPCAKVVTLHEVYERSPWSFPREDLRGTGIARAVREFLYDLRHPYEAALHRHTESGFHASRIQVHHSFQKSILVGKGLRDAAIVVTGYPVRAPLRAAPDPWTKPQPLRLVATGFINPGYDYDLLLDVLGRMPSPWTFTWAGGLRREEDRPLLDRLINRVRDRGWESRVRVTGWIDDEERDRILGDGHVCCAFFTARSSSESLATALAAGCIIVATPLPLTRELAGEGALTVAEGGAEGLAADILRLVSDGSCRAQAQAAAARYVERHGQAVIARKVLAVYQEAIRSGRA